MKLVEAILAGVFVLLGARSLVHWLRRPFEGGDVVDHVLFALFVTGRVGLWFALAGVFALYASTSTEGKAFASKPGSTASARIPPVLGSRTTAVADCAPHRAFVRRRTRST